jgi:hypothetical protein
MQKAKKLTIVILCGAALLSQSGKAEVAPACESIKKLCTAAGYKIKEKKNVYKDCFDPVMAGQTVPHVKVDSNTIAACEAQKKNFKHN